MMLIVDAAYVEALRDAAMRPGRKLVVFPPGAGSETFTNLVYMEGIAYYETELAILGERIKGLEARRAALSGVVEYSVEQRTGASLPIGPAEYIAALDALHSAEGLQRRLRTALDELRAAGTVGVERLLHEFELLAHDHQAPPTGEPPELQITLRAGFSLEPTPERRLEARRRRRTPLADVEQRANAAALLRRLTVFIPGSTSSEVRRVTHRAPTGELSEVTA